MIVFKLFKTLSKKEWGLIAVGIVLIVAQVWLDLKMPDYMSRITRLVQTEGSQMSEILEAGGMMLLCALGSLVSAALVAVLVGRVATGFGASLRARMFDKVQAFSMEEIGRFSTASLITRSTNDVTQVQMVIVMGMQAIIKAPITAGMAIGKISGKAWEWTFSTGVAIGLLLLIIAVGVTLALPKFRRVQALTDDLNRVTRENLTGLNVVRAYNAEGFQQNKFDGANLALMKNHLFTSRVMSSLMPGISLVTSGLSLAIYWIGAYLIQQASMMDKIGLFSDMVVFLSYAMQIVMAFMMLVMIFIILPRASVAAGRINEVLETRPTIVDPDVPQKPQSIQGEVEFRHVNFRYPDAEDDVLHDITFTAHKGETVALIGATGCGKSTVINLVPRFYEATEGSVLVDGIDVRAWSQEELRNRIGYVSQRAILFGGTVKSNIAYGDNGRGTIPQTDVTEAIATAQASEFVDKLDGAEDAFVAQGGTNLSGGQKQRLSIARAIARKPEILIFDDSFSALDYKTDRILRSALARECAASTKLIVAQRIGTIRDADRIVVLDEGRIAGMGTHDELMQTCEVYQQIAYSQLSKEELA